MKIISFEGIDGCGKTTQTDLLYEQLQGTKPHLHRFRYTAKDNFWGRRIKDFYALESKHWLKPLGNLTSVQELLYAFSARANLKKLDLHEDSLVLSDRCIATAYATHVGALPEWYITLFEPKFIPDIVFFLDVDPRVGLDRIKDRPTKYLDEDLESEIKFREAYLRFVKGDVPKPLRSTKFIRIDAHRAIDGVNKEIRRTLEELTVLP